MDTDRIVEKLEREQGRPREVARALIEHKNRGRRDGAYETLAGVLLRGNPQSLAEVYDNGPRRLFTAVHGKGVADMVGQVAARLTYYVHSPSVYRRSFRTKDITPYLPRFVQLLHTLFFDWKKFDMLRDLTGGGQAEGMPSGDPEMDVLDQIEAELDMTDDDNQRRPEFYGDFIALRIDQGDTQIIEAIREIILGDNNTRLLSHDIINGIVKSENRDLYKLLGDLLLAAKLQEGLRQSILENADNGRVEAFLYLIELVRGNDLLRYSSTVRALDVWMGLGEGFEDKRVAAKLLDLGYTYLRDAGACAAARESRDAVELYACLWAVSVREMRDAAPIIIQLSQSDEKYRVLTGLYFLGELENQQVQFEVCSRFVSRLRQNPAGADLDIYSLVMQYYPVTAYYYGYYNSRETREDFVKHCRSYDFLASGDARNEQFEGLLNLLPQIPPKGYKSAGKPFAWCSLSLDLSDVSKRLLQLAGYDFDEAKIDRLIDVLPKADPDSRTAFLKFFLSLPQKDEQKKDAPTAAEKIISFLGIPAIEKVINFFLGDAKYPGLSKKGRDFVFASLSDKSMAVRTQALANVRALAQAEQTLSDEEKTLVMNLLALKTGDIRQNCLKTFLALPRAQTISAAKKLLEDKQENKRLGGLDLLTQMVADGTLQRTEAGTFLPLMPTVTAKEQVLIRALTTEERKYTKANGFGMYDPNYRPSFPPLPRDKAHTLETLFGIRFERATALFDSLCALIKEHKDYTYQVENWDGRKDVLLGALTGASPRAEVKDDDSLTGFERFVLQEVWRDWMKRNALTYAEQCWFCFAQAMAGWNDEYTVSYEKWANALVVQCFRAKTVDQFIRWKAKKEYAQLAVSILKICWSEFPEEERFSVLSGAVIDLMSRLSETEWKQPINGINKRYYSDNEEPDTFADTEEAQFLLNRLESAVKDDGRFKTYTALCFELGRLTGFYYTGLSVTDAARGVEMGILQKDVLYRRMFLDPAEHTIKNYAGKKIWDRYKKDIETYPLLKTAADESAARVIEIELDRGDSPTEVTALAEAIRWHEGSGTLVKILTALGSETLVRGYNGNAGDKKTTLSSLLKCCHPAPDDTVETLRANLAESGVSDKRLIEAAMYAPSWLDLVGDYLGWPGLKSAAWYFHAHINESFSAEKETEVARYSPITPQEFNDGAFDITWFRDAYETLGAERFALVYDCAKYLTDGANHRRAQLFADAVLGKLDPVALAEEIHDKRNRDKLLSYSIIPLGSGEPVMTEALRRYEFIQSFLKESKSFGAQRRASEASACAIAVDNLARNAGFQDALRFSWRMETLKIDSIKAYFEPAPVGDYFLRISINDEGIAELVCEKPAQAKADRSSTSAETAPAAPAEDSSEAKTTPKKKVKLSEKIPKPAKEPKPLASIPSAIKKAPYVIECRETAGALKDQYRRAKSNLELEMVNRDVFEFAELASLMEHPVIRPLLKKLVFLRIDDAGKGVRAGFFEDLRDEDSGSRIRIAHPFDLYTLGNWLNFQRIAFEQRLVQPFKQIFRELYLLNEDERNEKTLSRRYAGHQVQPKKTAALLKSRGWTVDYEEGLQRVYYRENFYAALYAAADWFSPADTEAPTLETVRFFPRRVSSGTDYHAIDLEKIPPVIFSEVMRDIDLVVSAAHVGGVDPEASHSTVEMRAAIIRELLGLLHIENVSVEDRFAKIRGSLGEYTVHLGSAQVHKMGRGAVNILAIPSQHRGRVFLPFADDDPRTAEVMSKIILLAEDKTIKDPSILSQLE